MTFLDLVAGELAKAEAKHAPIHSAHEAIAVIREEYLEAEKEVFAQHVDRAAFLKELIQLAAMCARAAKDLGLMEQPVSVPTCPCENCGKPMDNLQGQFIMRSIDGTKEVCHECEPTMRATGWVEVARAKGL